MKQYSYHRHVLLCGLLLSLAATAQTNVNIHPFSVGEEKVVYFSTDEPTRHTWQESFIGNPQILSKLEWNHLLNDRLINGIAASNFRGWAQLLDEQDDHKVTAAYAVLLPDDWAEMYDFHYGAWHTRETEPKIVFNIGSTFANNPLKAADKAALQQAGAVFLPCDITASEGVYANGQYWTGTKEEEFGIYFVQFSSSATTPDEHVISIVGGGEVSDERYVLLAQQEVSITINENVNNVELLQPWATHHKPVNVQLIRSLTPGMYNTLCLPFDLTAGEVKTAFGETAKLAKFRSGTLSEDKRTLNIDFEEINLSDGTAIEAGVAYIIEPSQPVTNPTFAKRVIEKTTAVGENFSPKGGVEYLGIINPHQLEAGNRKYLFLQANNQLIWSKAGDTSSMNGMRGYFYVPDMPDMPTNCPARLSVRQAPQTPTDLEQVTDFESVDGGQCTMHNGKYIYKGQFVIIKDNKMYNAQGLQL